MDLVAMVIPALIDYHDDSHHHELSFSQARDHHGLKNEHSVWWFGRDHDSCID
jgi:hypothetical protein